MPSKHTPQLTQAKPNSIRHTEGGTYIPKTEASEIAKQALIDYLGINASGNLAGDGWTHLISSLPVHKTLPTFKVGVPIISPLDQEYLMSTVIYQIPSTETGPSRWANVKGITRYIDKHTLVRAMQDAWDFNNAISNTSVSFPGLNPHPNKSEYGWLDTNTFQYYMPETKNLFMNWKVSPFDEEWLNR